MPSGWTNGRLPKQKIDFVINDNDIEFHIDMKKIKDLYLIRRKLE